MKVKNRFNGTKGTLGMKREDGTKNFQIFIGDSEQVIATVHDEGDAEKTLANAHLLASAKVLYKQLRHLVGASKSQKSKAIEGAIYAIALAEGKSFGEKMTELAIELSSLDSNEDGINSRNTIINRTINLNEEKLEVLRSDYEAALKEGRKYISVDGNNIGLEEVKSVLDTIDKAERESDGKGIRVEKHVLSHVGMIRMNKDEFLRLRAMYNEAKNQKLSKFTFQGTDMDMDVAEVMLKKYEPLFNAQMQA